MRRSSNGTAEFVLVFVISFVVIVGIVAFLGGYFAMLGLGILHAHFMAAVPALGYGDSVWTTIGLMLVLGSKDGVSQLNALNKKKERSAAA